MSVRTGFLTVCLATALLLPAAGADGAYPGSNGQIAFIRDWQVWTMNADGTGQTQLTTDPSAKSLVQWSPDGTQIAYMSGSGDQRQVRVMNPDGSGDRQVAGPYAYSPSWAPDGSRIAFVAPYLDDESGSTFYEVVDADLDGTRRHHIAFGEQDFGTGDRGPVNDLEWSPKGDEVTFTDGPDEAGAVVAADIMDGSKERLAGEPECCWAGSRGAWSPDGSKVAFIRLDFPGLSDLSMWTMNRDGSGLMEVTSSVSPLWVEWSPDGEKLIVSECATGTGCDFYSMNPDGTGRTQLTSGPANDFWLDWQPLVSSVGPGYPRPKAASPHRVSLVPAYTGCTAPNRTHGPPLAFPSCSPPAQASSFLTMGTADSNGAAANMTGFLRLSMINIAPGLPQSDVRFIFEAKDVRCQSSVHPGFCPEVNFNAGPDYSGSLRGFLSLRVTDRYNLPSPGGRAAGTIEGNPTVRFDPQCTTTPGTTGAGSNGAIGSTCALDTTINALLPGAVAEKRRSIWEIDDVRILDGGASGGIDAGSTDNTLFLRQGVFIP